MVRWLSRVDSTVDAKKTDRFEAVWTRTPCRAGVHACMDYENACPTHPSSCCPAISYSLPFPLLVLFAWCAR